jgi:hypothetical protein
MDVTLANGTVYTVPKDAIIIPRYTDRKTYVTVELEDGRLGTAQVSIINHRYCINGIDQDEYAQLPYAD